MGEMMTRYNQLLCVIGLTFMVGCTDCSDMSDDDVTASTPLPDTTIPTEATEPSTPMGVCGDVTPAPTNDVPTLQPMMFQLQPIQTHRLCLAFVTGTI